MERGYVGRIKLINEMRGFGPVIQTPKGVNPIRYKWVFVRNRNENDEIIRYKSRLVAQGFL